MPVWRRPVSGSGYTVEGTVRADFNSRPALSLRSPHQRALSWHRFGLASFCSRDARAPLLRHGAITSLNADRDGLTWIIPHRVEQRG